LVVVSPRARICANDDAQSDDDDDNEASVLEAILGRQVGQREDTAYDEDEAHEGSFHALALSPSPTICRGFRIRGTYN